MNFCRYKNKTLIELYGMFVNKKWDKLANIQKKFLMKAVLAKEKEGLKPLSYQKADMQLILLDKDTFSKFKISVKFKKLDEGYAGEYDPDKKCISLFKRPSLGTKKNSGIYTYCTLMHEFQHAVQDYFIDNIECYNKNPEECKYINRIKIVRDTDDIEINFCSINGKANFHFKKIIVTQNIQFDDSVSKLSEMFYTLNITERDAFYYAKIKGDNVCHYFKQQNINLDIDCDYKFLEDELSQFRKTYHCQNKTDTEIFEVIDKCIDNLYMGNPPEDDLCATVMYDIACIMLILRKESSGEEICEEDLEILFPENKRRNMAKENFAVYGENTRYGKYVIVQDLENHKNEYSMDICKFKKLTPEQKKNNPQIILLAASRIGDGIKKYITNLDALEAFCMADKESLRTNNELRHGMAVIFGDGFVECLYGTDE